MDKYRIDNRPGSTLHEALGREEARGAQQRSYEAELADQRLDQIPGTGHPLCPHMPQQAADRGSLTRRISSLSSTAKKSWVQYRGDHDDRAALSPDSPLRSGALPSDEQGRPVLQQDCDCQSVEQSSRRRLIASATRKRRSLRGKKRRRRADQLHGVLSGAQINLPSVALGLPRSKPRP